MPIRKSNQFYVLLTLGFFALIPTHAFAAEESITVTTYYPSPYGVYSEMRLYPKSYSQATPCDANNEGLMFFDSDSSAHTLKVCMCKNPPTCVTSSNFGWVAATSYWTLSASGTNLYTNSNNWNVGIGTPLPSEKLDVNGNIKLSTAQKLKFTHLGGGSGNTGWIGALDASTLNALHVSGENYILFDVLGAERMRVNSSGNVGIGTPGPSYKLDVAGYIRSSSGGFIFPDNTVQTTASGRVSGLTSPSGQYYLAMQDDGNLVMYSPWGVRFSTGTWGGKLDPTISKAAMASITLLCRTTVTSLCI